MSVIWKSNSIEKVQQILGYTTNIHTPVPLFLKCSQFLEIPLRSSYTYFPFHKRNHMYINFSPCFYCLIIFLSSLKHFWSIYIYLRFKRYYILYYNIWTYHLLSNLFLDGHVVFLKSFITIALHWTTSFMYFKGHFCEYLH